MTRLVLASESPRRRALLPLLGLPVESAASDVDERPLPGERPAAVARRLAIAKARIVPDLPYDALVLGADTLVVYRGQMLGKPASPGEACRTLRRLAGRAHGVLTGVAVAGSGKVTSGVVRTRVVMRAYAELEIDEYVRSGRPMDKAGAYAIQDADFGPVERIDGCYLNVVGLPLCEVARQLSGRGLLPAERFEPPCRYCVAGRELLER